MQVAHRRHEADRAPSATGGLERLAQLGLGADHPHAGASAAALASSRARSASASYSGSSSGAISRSAARCRSTVAASPRAIGPVSASGAALCPVRRRAEDERREQLARVLDPDPVEQLGGRFLEGDQQVGGDRGGGVVGGAPFLGHLEGTHPQALGEPLGSAKGARARARDGARRAGQVGAAVGDRLERMEGEGLGASLACRRQGVEGRGAAHVARRSEAAAPRPRSSRRHRRSRRRARTAGPPRPAGRLREPVRGRQARSVRPRARPRRRSTAPPCRRR